MLMAKKKECLMMLFNIGLTLRWNLIFIFTINLLATEN
jgi:hypothetical protein